MGRYAIILIITLVILLSFYVIHVNNQKTQALEENIDELSYRQAKNIANSATQMIARKLLLPESPEWPDFTEDHLGTVNLKGLIPAEFTNVEIPSDWSELKGKFYVNQLQRVGTDLHLTVVGIENERNIQQQTKVMLKENDTMLYYWDYAVYSKTTILMNNPNPFIDSYNSDDGPYDPNNPNSNAPVGTDLPYTSPNYPINRLDQIHGPDPDYAAGKYLPPVEMPPGGEPLNASGNSNLTVTEGFYRIDGDLSRGGNGTLTFEGDVILAIYGNMSVAGNAIIAIGNAANPNSSLKIYIDGNADIGGTGFVNYSQIPANLQIFGTENCTSIDFRGTADTHAAIYAPYADVRLVGTTNFFGAIVCNEIDFVGTPAFHYDEALGGPGGPTFNSLFKYYIASWE